MEKRDITERTFKFGVEIIKLINLLPRTVSGQIVAHQLGRSGTSVGANTEEAQDGLTRKEFIKSLNVALKETRETRFWLRIIIETKLLPKEKVESLINESEELIKILITIIKKCRANS